MRGKFQIVFSKKVHFVSLGSSCLNRAFDLVSAMLTLPDNQNALEVPFCSIAGGFKELIEA